MRLATKLAPDPDDHPGPDELPQGVHDGYVYQGGLTDEDPPVYCLVGVVLVPGVDPDDCPMAWGESTKAPTLPFVVDEQHGFPWLPARIFVVREAGRSVLRSYALMAPVGGESHRPATTRKAGK